MDVLVAHESRVVRNMLRRGLGATRCAAAHPREAGTAAELLRRLDEPGSGETLVLLDWNLPGLHVPTLLSYLAGTRALGRISILLCVNEGQAAQAEEAVRRGARGVLVRPFTDADLAAKIEEIDRTGSATAAEVLQDIVTTARLREELPSLLSLPSEILSELFHGAERLRHAEGAMLLAPEDRIESLPFVTAGEVEILEAGERTARGAGECYAERAFVCGEPARIRVRARTPVEIVSIRKETVVELARRLPALQDFLTRILTQRGSRGAGEGEAEMAGTTASLPFSDLLQYLHSSRKSGVLVLESEGASGRITLERGEVRDARAEGGETGDEAFALLAALPEARFEFRSGISAGARTVTRSTMQLLMGCFLQPAA